MCSRYLSSKSVKENKMEGERKIHTYIQTDTITTIFWPLLLRQRKMPDSRFLETTMINIDDINTYFTIKNQKLPESYMLSKPMCKI